MNLFLESVGKSTLVGLGTLLLLALLRRASARVRHGFCAGGILLMVTVPFASILSRSLNGPRLIVLLPRTTVSAKQAPFLAPSSPPKPVPVVLPPTAPKLVAAPVTPVSPDPSPRPIAVWPLVWASGFIACLLPWLSSLLQLVQFLRRAQLAPDTLSPQAVALIGSKRPVLLLLSDATSVPLTAGLARPVIVLPSAATSWSSAQVTTAVRHELAHIRRGDFLTQNVAYVLCALYWFHPLIWLLAARLRSEAEAACDAQVVASGIAATEYATSLLQIAKDARCTPISRTAATMASTSRLEQRMKTILTPAPTRLSRRQLLIAACGALSLTVLTSLRIEAHAPALVPPSATETTSGMPPAPPSDPDAVEFLKQSMDTYAALKTFQADADWWLTYPDGTGRDTREHPADYTRTITYAAPNRFRIVSTAYKALKNIYVSDGERMVIVKEGFHQAPERFSAPASLAVADKNNMSHPHFGGSALYRFFAGRDGYDHLIDAETAWSIRKHKPQAVRWGPDVVVGGEPCKTVIFGGGLYYDEQRAIISTRDHLVRRLESFEAGGNVPEEDIAQRKRDLARAKDPAQKKVIAAMLTRTHMPDALTIEEYKHLRTDATVDPRAFALPKIEGTAQVGHSRPEKTVR